MKKEFLKSLSGSDLNKIAEANEIYIVGERSFFIEKLMPIPYAVLFQQYKELTNKNVPCETI